MAKFNSSIIEHPIGVTLEDLKLKIPSKLLIFGPSGKQILPKLKFFLLLRNPTFYFVSKTSKKETANMIFKTLYKFIRLSKSAFLKVAGKLNFVYLY